VEILRARVNLEGLAIEVNFNRLDVAAKRRLSLEQNHFALSVQ